MFFLSLFPWGSFLGFFKVAFSGHTTPPCNSRPLVGGFASQVGVSFAWLQSWCEAGRGFS